MAKADRLEAGGFNLVIENKKFWHRSTLSEADRQN